MVESQGILKTILSGNPGIIAQQFTARADLFHKQSIPKLYLKMRQSVKVC